MASITGLKAAAASLAFAGSILYAGLPAVAATTETAASKKSSKAASTKSRLPKSIDGVDLRPDVKYLPKGRAETLDLYLPVGRTSGTLSPAVVLIHGGGWVGGSKDYPREIQTGTALARNGYVAASVEYMKDAGKRWPTNLHDCKNAVRYLRANAKELQIDPDRIGVIGGSAGGHLSLMVAFTSGVAELEPAEPYPGVSSQVDACINLYGIVDVARRQGTTKDGTPNGEFRTKTALFPETVEEAPEKYKFASPISYVDEDVPPTLTIHGTADTTVDRDQATLLDEKMKAAGAHHELLMLPGAPHAFTLNSNKVDQDLRPVVLNFFDRHLKGQYTTGTASSASEYAALALRESANAIRPGVPGVTPFWNEHARRFIYAPAFNFKTIPDAVAYRFDLVSQDKKTSHSFTSDLPSAPLSPVWTEIPVGFVNLNVIGLSKDGSNLGLAGERQFYRAAPFAGPYHEPPQMAYDESARLALDRLMHKDYVNHWLVTGEPDPEYGYYRYPAKIYTALIAGAVAHTRMKPEEADRSTSIARVIADYLVDISYPAGSAWEFSAPTYHGPRIGKSQKSHMQLENHLTIMGADAGQAYLDLYDLTNEQKYLEAALRIADTYKKSQLDSGTWYLYVNYATGDPIADNLAIPTAVVNFLERLRDDYNVKDYTGVSDRALAWIMENPAKSFNWQGQFEDVRAKSPYENQSREQACDLAIYLLKRGEQLELATDLIRFAEDQFVIWEQPMPFQVKPNNKNPGWNSKNWMTPSVQEQHGFWMPVMRSAGIMMETYRQAFIATGEEIYLEKARSLANSIVRVQQANDGDYVTMFIDTPWNFWLNSVVYPSIQMMKLHETIAQ